MRKKMLVIGLVWPEPTSSAAGWRILQIIDLFISNGFEVTFASAASKSEFSYPLQDKGIVEQEIALNDSTFDQWIQDLEPDYVLFDRFMVEEQYSWRISQSCPTAVRILDTEDLHFVRNARQEAYKKGLEEEKSMYYSDLAKRELASIYRSDLSILISEFEINLLKDEFRIDPALISYLPFRLESRNKIEVPSFEERSNFMFIGNFIHEPNWKTVQVIKEIWPIIRKRLPKAEVHIYGAYPSEKVNQLHNEAQGFFIKGRAEDAVETMKNYRVLLAPIPFGAGQKGKFIDALYAGTASVSSLVGAEGMFQGLAWPGYIADTTAELIEKAILLHEDKEEWEISRQKSLEILRQFDGMNWGQNLMKQIVEIEDDLSKHRSKNMVGQILWSSQFLSTKYLSQWIEEKNKKAQT
ncbi:glycosyltransferase [Sphingobacterium endophyticum]|uniref:glycosyltransferase n=1 Tax=Sphingobacterium endophyticum TaxID=2546448 RepID=UPI001E30B05F|nr:glycosyltransferase [Sphingobacterium endophyticum]